MTNGEYIINILEVTDIVTDAEPDNDGWVHVAIDGDWWNAERWDGDDITCDNCKYEFKDESEEPCCECVHAAFERFEPKGSEDERKEELKRQIADNLLELFEMLTEGVRR